MPIWHIPFCWLPYFALTEDRVDLRRPDAFPADSIFTLLNNSGRSVFYDSFTSLHSAVSHRTDEQRLAAVIDHAAKTTSHLYLVYISAADTRGHLYGPESSEIRVLRHVDAAIEEFVWKFETLSPGSIRVLR